MQDEQNRPSPSITNWTSTQAYVLAAFCLLVWQGGQSADLLNLFQGFSRSFFSPLVELWAAASGASAWMTVLGVAGLSTLAFFASLAIFLLRDQT